MATTEEWQEEQFDLVPEGFRHLAATVQAGMVVREGEELDLEYSPVLERIVSVSTLQDENARLRKALEEVRDVARIYRGKASWNQVLDIVNLALMEER